MRTLKLPTPTPDELLETLQQVLVVNKTMAMVAKRMIHPERDAGSSITRAQYELLFPLQPYKHQVAGHGAIFLLDNEHVCKPWNQGEADFYRTRMPVELQQFVPDFCSETELKMNEFKNTYDLRISNSNPSCSRHHPTTIKQLAICPDEKHYKFLDLFSGSSSAVNINPWSLECQLRTIKSDYPNRFMVFENLARLYSMPNVLDLKLGIRQYADNATEQKKQSQTRKCDKSTSKRLGMRLCGLQYFDEKLGVFQCLDKYQGRNLREKKLFSLISHFLCWSDDKVRTSDCMALLGQIEEMIQVIKSKPGLRLFGVSLLIILEGNPSVFDAQPPIARLIDFAHATVDLNDLKPDDGCLMGLRNLSLTLSSILSK